MAGLNFDTILRIFLLLFLLFVTGNYSAGSSGSIVYTREQLIALCKPVLLPGDRAAVPQELRRRSRGCRSGAKRREKRRRHKPAVPAIITGNVRSLGNKTDELAALVKTQREYRECSIFCFSETWLHSHIPDSSVEVPGYSLVRGDRDFSSSKKKKGGGLALYVSERWCNPGHVNGKERLCTPDIELLAVGMRPYYLPREFTSAIVIAVYIPPSADAAVACEVISSTAAKLLTEHPDAFMVITGDFNHASLDKTLNNFHQYIDCPTRENKTLDLLYANATEAYYATALPPLGRSDHNLVRMNPRYVPLVKRQPKHTRTVRTWTHDATEALQDCFESTDWDVLCEPHGEDIDNMTDCITEYIRFCEDTTIPARTVACFSNNKPWITSDLKALLNEKKRAFRSGDREEQRRVQHRLRDMLRKCKDDYRRKLEAKLQQNSVRDVWTGMKHITGMKGKDRQTSGSLDRANQFNQFFNRFSSPPATSQTPPAPHTSTLSQMASTSPQYSPAHHLSIYSPSFSFSSSSPSTSTNHPMVTTGQVKRQLERLNQRKAAGPDGITPRILKTCASQLSPVLRHLFNLSLSHEKVPKLWKTSCLVPVPKKPRPSDPADYRPIALTSHVMKVLERLVLAQLRPQVRTFLDPLQFAYQPHLGVDDAVIYLLQRAHMHLDGGGGTVRITFFDFSSAFNTIQPLLLGEKLQGMGVDDTVISWITDYLTGRPQFVRLGSGLSDVVVSDTGAPQGTVLSPFLFTLYTTDFKYNSESCHLQKFSDDSAVVGCIREGEEGEYRTLIDNFVEWSEQNHLRLNINKTREMVIDFRRKKTPSQPLRIRGEEVEEVADYKYLGVVIDNGLDWKSNTEAVYKKGMSRLYFLRKLRSFNVCSKMLEIFYQSVVASAIFFAVVCWGGSIRASDTNRLEKIIKKAGSVLGLKLESFETVMERRKLNKLLSIMDNDQHPLHHTVNRQRSTFSHRLLQLRCRRDRYRKSFRPHAITLYNNS